MDKALALCQPMAVFPMGVSARNSLIVSASAGTSSAQAELRQGFPGAKSHLLQATLGSRVSLPRFLSWLPRLLSTLTMTQNLPELLVLQTTWSHLVTHKLSKCRCLAL